MSVRVRDRVLAALTLFFFSSQSVVGASPLAPSSRVPPLRGGTRQSQSNDALIPGSLGTVEEEYLPENFRARATPFVFLLRDAHANPEAQEKIRDILSVIASPAPPLLRRRRSNLRSEIASSPAERRGGLLAKTAGRPLVVGLEGAFSPIDPAPFQFFDTPELNRKVRDALWKAGELTGAELLAYEEWEKRAYPSLRAPRSGGTKQSTGSEIASSSRSAAIVAETPRPPAGEAGNDVEFVGADDPRLYRESFIRLRRLFRAEPEIRKFLAALDRALETKEKRARPALRDYLQWKKLWGNSSDGNFLKAIGELSQLSRDYLKLNLADARNQFDYPNLVRLAKLREIEKRLKLELTQREFLEIKRGLIRDATRDAGVSSVEKPRLRRPINQSPGRKEPTFDSSSLQPPFGPPSKSPQPNNAAVYMIAPKTRVHNENSSGRFREPMTGPASDTVPALVKNVFNVFRRSSVSSNIRSTPTDGDYSSIIESMQYNNLPRERAFFEWIYREAKARGVELLDYPHFLNYAGLLILQEELQPQELFEEVEKISTLLAQKLVRSAADRALVSRREDFLLLSKLLTLEMSREDWER